MFKRILVVAGAGLTLTGCPGPYQQQKLQQDVDGLKRELAALRAQNAASGGDAALRTRLADLGASLEQLRTDISLLQGRLESMQDSSARKGDEQLKVRQELEIRIAQLDEQVRALQSMIDELKKGGGPPTTTADLTSPPLPRFSPPPDLAAPTPAPVPPGVRETVAAVISPTPVPAASAAPPAKETDQQMYQRGAEALDAKRYADARAIWSELITKFPRSSYADNARYWIGESYYAERDFASAILEFDKVVRDYPAGDKVPAALLKQGLAFLEIGEKDGGVATLQDLVKRYPRSDEAKKAKERLAKLR